MRQMKEESERFRAMKAEKDKEILQLKQQVVNQLKHISIQPAYSGIMDKCPRVFSMISETVLVSDKGKFANL